MAGETVTRLRKTASGVDRYGNPLYPDAPAEKSIDGAFFAPGGTSEPVEPGRSPVITEPTLYFPHAWPDIVVSDQLRVRGVVYDVTGFPSEWRSPYGSQVGGQVVTLRRTDG
jgi:hypothetical protein